MTRITAELVRGVEPTGPTDPIAYYRRPLVGLLYRERINRGLRMLPRGPLGSVLEVGFGSGTVLLALGSRSDDLCGIDLDAEPAAVEPTLRSRGVRATLVRGSVLDLPYPEARFDWVVSFSVFEHLREYRRALAEVARVLKPGGHLLLGMPAVNRAMEVAFRVVGFKGIEDHHVTTPAEVHAALAGVGLRVEESRHLDMPLPPPLGMRLYYDWRIVKA